MNPVCASTWTRWSRGFAERHQITAKFKPAFITPAGLAALGLASDVGTPEEIVEPDARQLMREFEMVHAGEVGVELDAAPRAVTLEGRQGVRPDGDYLFPVVGGCMMPVFRAGDVVVMRPDDRPADGSIVHSEKGIEITESGGRVWVRLPPEILELKFSFVHHRTLQR